LKKKFQMEMEVMKNNDENIQALNALNSKNERREIQAAKLGKDTDISSKHVKAARQILKFYMIAKRNKKRREEEARLEELAEKEEAERKRSEVISRLKREKEQLR